MSNFSFRNASPFVATPAGIAFDISIQPANSTDTVGALFRQTYTLDTNETHLLVANGIISTTGSSTGPNVDISVFPSGREVAGNAYETDVLVFHGATDAPAVTVNERTVPVPALINNIAYGNFDGYLELGIGDYE